MVRRPQLLSVAMFATWGVFAGCQQSDIRAYTVPKEDAPAPAASPVGQRPAPGGFPVWELPAGWQELPGSGMRFATLIMGAGDHAPELRVTPLGPIAGDALQNVNRWRGQIGLAPIDASGLSSVLTTIDRTGSSVDVIRLVSEDDSPDGPQEILAAILRTEERVWFFMTTGPRERIEPHEDTFHDFVRSIRMSEPERVASAPFEAGDTEAGGELAWTLPPGWSEVPSTSSLRLATFRAGAEDDAAEVAITKFPGRVGGLLANVNRWRGQLGLAPVNDLAEQEQTTVNVAGSSAMWLDLAREGDGPADARMLVVLAARRDFTWFLKMTGSRAVLTRERSAFEAFVRSVELPGAS